MSRRLAKSIMDFKYNKVINSYKLYRESYRIHCYQNTNSSLLDVQQSVFLLFEDVKQYGVVRNEQAQIYSNIVLFYPVFLLAKRGNGVVLYTTEFKQVT